MVGVISLLGEAGKLWKSYTGRNPNIGIFFQNFVIIFGASYFFTAATVLTSIPISGTRKIDI